MTSATFTVNGQKVANQQGEDLIVSPALEDLWSGRPALRYDASYDFRANNKRAHA
jgi:hypothetical protein